MVQAVTTREAVRAVIVAERESILLMQMQFPWNSHPVWIAPGGGLQAGESTRAALLRELAEEVGRADLTIGTFLFERTFDIHGHERIVRQHETYFLVPCERFMPAPRALELDERSYFRGFEWWPLAEVAKDPSVAAGPDILASIERTDAKTG